MSDTEPIMRDHSDTSEEEQNELRKINQDNAQGDTLLGGIDHATGSITRPLAEDAPDADEMARDAVRNDQDQR